MLTLKILDFVGKFAENKDEAQALRNEKIVPALEKGEEIILNFEEVEAATQSFIHALISELIRRYGVDILDRITFKNCNETVQKIISIVVDYMQAGD